MKRFWSEATAHPGEVWCSCRFGSGFGFGCRFGLSSDSGLLKVRPQATSNARDDVSTLGIVCRVVVQCQP